MNIFPLNREWSTRKINEHRWKKWMWKVRVVKPPVSYGLQVWVSLHERTIWWKIRLPYAMWSFQKKFQALPNYLGRFLSSSWMRLQLAIWPAKQFAFDNSECGLCFTAFLSQAIIFSKLLCLRKLSASWQTTGVMTTMMTMVIKRMKSSFYWNMSRTFQPCLPCLNSFVWIAHLLATMFVCRSDQPIWSTNQYELLICSSFARKQVISPTARPSVLEGIRWNHIQIGSDPSKQP